MRLSICPLALSSVNFITIAVVIVAAAAVVIIGYLIYIAYRKKHPSNKFAYLDEMTEEDDDEYDIDVISDDDDYDYDDQDEDSLDDIDVLDDDN